MPITCARQGLLSRVDRMRAGRATILDRLGFQPALCMVTITRIDETLQKMVTECRWARRTVQSQAEHLRGFLRYAEMHGWPQGLAQAIQSPRVFSQTSLPRGPSWNDVRRLIATTEGDRPADIRDRAILLLLAVYGLRADEVRRLRVEDFDWNLERLTVRCPKSRRTRTFPLCRSVGDAVLRYVKEVRPRSDHRAVFLSLQYPICPLGNVWRVVAKRLRPLGVSLPTTGRIACDTPVPLISDRRPLTEGDRRSSRTPAF